MTRGRLFPGVGAALAAAAIAVLAAGGAVLPAAQTPAPQTLAEGVVVARAVKVPMRDGVRLAVDIYFPAEDGRVKPGKLPAVLLKHPYGRSGAERDGTYYARRGYVFVMADCRGSRDSEGTYYLYTNDGEDGYDLVEWLASQSWSNGAVATDGGSHSGHTQYATGVHRPPHLRAQFVREASEDYHEGGAYQGGAFLQDHNLSYALSRTPDINRLPSDSYVVERMRRTRARVDHWMRLPAPRHLELFHDVPETAAWYRDWMVHPDYDDYWKQPGLNLKEHYGRYADVPVYVLGGWYDYFLGGTLRAFMGLKAATTTPKKLIVGPWIHGPQNIGRSSNGDVEFGREAAVDFLALRERWMAHWLKEEDTALLEEAPVRIFVMGTGDGHRTAEGKLFHGGDWRDEPAWPLARAKATRYYLQPGGALATTMPPASAPTGYTFDPADPVPTMYRYGAYDQRCRADIPYCQDTLPLAARPDVLVFRTPMLDRDVEVTGFLSATLLAASDAIDTDFTAKLIDEYPPSPEFPDGFALILNDGVIRARYRNARSKPEFLVPGEVTRFTIDMWATSNVFKKGHRVRLDVSSSNFPKFDANPNTGERPLFHTRMRPAHNRVYHDPEHASFVELPIVEREESTSPAAIAGLR